MPQPLRNFDVMWDAYPFPGGSAEDAKRAIGGAVDASWILNTCVIRVSRSMNASGNPIPNRRGDEIFTVRGADRKHYALRVREFQRYLRRRYGPASFGHDYPGRGGSIPGAFMGQRGIIVFEVSGWSDATGHVDLWDGAACRHASYFEVASSVSLWVVAEGGDTGSVTLSGSVGVRGRNRDADVAAVQQKLADAGYDPGPIDGKVGRRTIAAIREFQRRFMNRPDGRVDPFGRTWRELLGL